MEVKPTIEVNTFFIQEQWDNFCDYEKRNYEKQYQNFLTLNAAGLCDGPPPFVLRKQTTNKSTKYGRCRKRKSKEFEDDENWGPSSETQMRKKGSKLRDKPNCTAADGEQNKCHFNRIIKSSTTQETMSTSSSMKHSCSQHEMLKFWNRIAFLHPSTKKSKCETKLMYEEEDDMTNFKDYCSKIASGEPVSHSTYEDLLKRALVVIDKTTDHHILNDIGNETVSVDGPERLKIENITSKLNDCINRVLDRKFSMREIERINMQQPDLNDFELSLVALLFDDKNELSNESNGTIGDNDNGGLTIEPINDPKKKEGFGIHVNKGNEANDVTVSVDGPEKKLKIENITSKLNDCINRVLDRKFSMREIERINMQQPDLNDFELSLVALLFDDKNELSNESNGTIGDNDNGGLTIEPINDPKKKEGFGIHVNKGNEANDVTVSVDGPEKKLKIENITSKLNDCINRVLDRKFSMREIERINMQQPDLNDFELSLVALLFDDKNELSNDSNETIGDNGNGGLPIEPINDLKKREDCCIHVNKDNEAKEKHIHINDDEETVVKYPKRENFSWDSNKAAVNILNDKVLYDEASTRPKTFTSSNFGENNDPIVSKPIKNIPSISKDSIKNSFTVYINKVTDTKCDKPGNLMDDKENLAFMKRTGKFICFHCDFETNWSCILKSHMRKHTGDMFKCSHCNYETTKLKNLIVHERKHTGDILKCAYCNYETTQYCNLKTHERKHTGDMFKCSNCNYETTHYSNLKEHQRSHTGDMLQCTNCNYETIWSSSLKRHERNKH